MICISTKIEENWGQWSLMLSNNFCFNVVYKWNGKTSSLDAINIFVCIIDNHTDISF